MGSPGCLAEDVVVSALSICSAGGFRAAGMAAPVRVHSGGGVAPGEPEKPIEILPKGHGRAIRLNMNY
ncbi:hypothetical protein GCM10027091_35550 [Streptomyces daliensis]